jgi:hypothetical protein
MIRQKWTSLFLMIGLLLVFLEAAPSAAASADGQMLPRIYTEQVEVTGWLMSAGDGTVVASGQRTAISFIRRRNSSAVCLISRLMGRSGVAEAPSGRRRPWCSEAGTTRAGCS